MSDSKIKAVALKYPKNAPAPFICATGKGQVAKNILDIAQKNNIPIVENSDLTDVLTLQEIGTIIPEETWELIANIFSYIIEQDSVL
ncbi:MAG: EscU/YscU/HrcU family type III secretion system export apparatus switch protein [Treponema sp.]|nr:EscU/YscU/HrcU family type III secretion system export apparatus switch protein [Treponema sp.]